MLRSTTILLTSTLLVAFGCDQATSDRRIAETSISKRSPQEVAVPSTLFPEETLIAKSCELGEMQRQDVFSLGSDVVVYTLQRDICASNKGLGLLGERGKKVVFILQDPKGDHNGALEGIRADIPNIYRQYGWDVHVIDIGATMSWAKNSYGERKHMEAMRSIVDARLGDAPIEKATLIIADHGNDPAIELQRQYDFLMRLKEAGNHGLAAEFDPQARFPSKEYYLPTFPHYLGTIRTDILMAGFAEGMKEKGFNTNEKAIRAAVVSCFSGQLCEFLENSATPSAETIRESYAGVLTTSPDTQSARRVNAEFVMQAFAKLDASGQYAAEYDSNSDGRISMQEFSETTTAQARAANDSSFTLNLGFAISLFTNTEEETSEYFQEVLWPQFPVYDGDTIFVARPDGISK